MYVLLTRTPVANNVSIYPHRIAAQFQHETTLLPLDLHVLGLPLAFILS